MKRIAAFGDVHGCIDELQDLYKRLEWESIDEIRHCGDLVDRGPDSGAVVAFCRENNIQGVKGNHESAILSYINKGTRPKLGDKIRTLDQLKDSKDIEYLNSLPHLHVDDSINTLWVHAGLLPDKAIHEQPPMLVNHLQLINPAHYGETRWFTKDKKGRTEEENRKEGWLRWYEVYDGSHNVVYGHTVYQHGPFIYQYKDYGKTIGVDTGCVWSGQLTAVIMPDIKFVATPKKQEFTIWHPVPDHLKK